MPSTSKWKDTTTSLPGTTTAVPGSQLSAGFVAHNLSASSYTSVSSGIQDALPMSSVKGGKGGGRGKRKGRKKVATTMDHLPEESKSAEYKAFEAFLKANHGMLHDMVCDRSRNYVYPSTHTHLHTHTFTHTPPHTPPHTHTFTLSTTAPSPLDDLDLTGQEDPVILHTVIAALPSQLAYREGEASNP